MTVISGLLKGGGSSSTAVSGPKVNFNNHRDSDRESDSK